MKRAAAQRHDAIEHPQIPPQDMEAEGAVLGAILLDNNALAIAQDVLSAQMFYSTRHRLIFQGMVALSESTQPIDNLTLTDQLKKDGVLEKVGGAAYLAELFCFVASAANVSHHAQLVRDAALRRHIRELAIETILQANDPTLPIQELLETAAQSFLQITQGPASDGFIDLPTVIVETVTTIQDHAKNPEIAAGIPTGFRELDALTGGLHGGELTIIAARTAMGKTALALGIAGAASSAGYSVGIFSLEMKRRQIGLRFLGGRSKVSIQSLRTGRLSPDEWKRLAEAAQQTTPGTIHIDDNSIRSVSQIQMKVHRLKSRQPLDLLIIDYLQLLNGPSTNRRENRQQEVADISRSLKLLAMNLEIPVLTLSQLNRKPDDRDDKRPVLSDLRDSGAIEQDADVVMLLYREEVYQTDTNRRGLADLFIRKNRNGPMGEVTLRFTPDFARFDDPERV